MELLTYGWYWWWVHSLHSLNRWSTIFTTDNKNSPNRIWPQMQCIWFAIRKSSRLPKNRQQRKRMMDLGWKIELWRIIAYVSCGDDSTAHSFFCWSANFRFLFLWFLLYEYVPKSGLKWPRCDFRFILSNDFCVYMTWIVKDGFQTTYWNCLYIYITLSESNSREFIADRLLF